MRKAAIFCSLTLAALARCGRPSPNHQHRLQPGRDSDRCRRVEHASNVLDAGYRTELRRKARTVSPLCRVVAPAVIERFEPRAPAVLPPEPYIGKSIRFNAWLRLDQASNGGTSIFECASIMRRPFGSTDSLAPRSKCPVGNRGCVRARGSGRVSIAIWARYVPSGYAWLRPDVRSCGRYEGAEAAAFGVATATFPVKDAAGKTIRLASGLKPRT